MSSKRHQRREACQGKKRYETYEEATRRARQDNYLYHTRMGAYKCPFSGQTPHYHVGHPPAEIRRVVAARRRGETA
jgi:hypothetical protein